MQVQAIKGYQAANVTTTDRLRLVIMCYEGCIAHATRAKEEMKRGNLPDKGIYLGKATSIVSELMNVLDMEKGGEIAERLEALYRYILGTFSQANLQNDPESIEEALRVLKELKEGWVALSEQGVNPSVDG